MPGLWPYDAAFCPQCAAERVCEDGRELHIPLSFAIAVCDTCGKAGADGVCPTCGAELDAPEPNEATRARVSALRPLGVRATALVESFGAFPDPHIPVTAQQAISVVTDANLPQRAIELIDFAHGIGDLDLTAPAAIGGSLASV